MSGDSQRNEDFDPLEDDFVIEDLAGKNDDLESLFESPAAPKPAQPAAPVDSDDVLFTDHTVGIDATENFQGRQQFAEQGKSDWQGESLELDENKPATPDAPLDEAEAAFTEELGSMLSNEEDGIDSDEELELVDGPPAGDGIDEIEQSGPFVLDDGEGTWQEQTTAASASHDDASEGDEQPAVEAEVAEGVWEAVKDPAMAEHATEDAAIPEEGWEALPETSVDQLSEVDEVAASAEAEAQPGPEELAGVEGHDIYGDEAPVLVGPRAERRRASGMLIALAASLTIVGGAAVVVLRPEWVGLHLEAEKLQAVQVERPRVQIAASAPPAVPAAAPELVKVDPQPTPPPLPETQPQPDGANGGKPTTDPVATTPTPTPDTAPATTPETSPVATTPPAATLPESTPEVHWPVAAATPGEGPTQPNAAPKPRKGSLVRVDESLMLGDADGSATPRPVQAVDGAPAGARAFAQLHNGNFFIGSIKLADKDRVTLRVEDGEVTLPAEEIARLTALGSADYEALQRATSGFVRLTNNNKLVGGILSQIADDHIVLEFRSNRVILPKSVVGSVVAGEEEQGVRLDTTREEDDWLKTLAQRQVGQPVADPNAAPPQSPAPPAGASPNQAPANPAPRPNQPAPNVPEATPAVPPAQPPRR